MSPHTKKLALIAAVMVVALGAFFAVLHNSRKDAEKYVDQSGEPVSVTPVVAEEVEDLPELTEREIEFGTTKIKVPAPDGYCFINPEYNFDKTVLDVVENMQKGYGNKLHLAFANCEQIKAVRKTHDLNTYIDTGMIVTPVPLLDKEVPAQGFVNVMGQQLKKLNPVGLEDRVNTVVKDNLSKNAAVKSGQPVIYDESPENLSFLMTHQLKDDAGNMTMALTEFDTVTAVKNRPMVVIFTYKDLQDHTAQQDFTKTYLAKLRAANP